MGIMPQGWYPYGISYLHRKESMYVKIAFIVIILLCIIVVKAYQPCPTKVGKYSPPPMAISVPTTLLNNSSNFWDFCFFIVILFFYITSSKTITTTIIRATSCLIVSIIGIEFALYKTRSHLQTLCFLKRGATLSQPQNTWS